MSRKTDNFELLLVIGVRKNLSDFFLWLKDSERRNVEFQGANGNTEKCEESQC